MVYGYLRWVEDRDSEDREGRIHHEQQDLLRATENNTHSHDDRYWKLLWNLGWV